MRGSFKNLLVIVAVALMLLAACKAAAPANQPAAAATTAGSASTSAAAGTVGPCGDKTKLSKSVSFYNWGDYIDPDILKQFKTDCGVDVVYDTFSSNEDLLAKLQGGATGYDLIVPSDYMVTTMINLKMLKPLDFSNIPNMANLDKDFLNKPFDPGNKYSVPYLWGVAGIGYDADKVATPPTSLASLFDPAQAKQYAGKISLLDDERETIGAALKYLGYSINSTNPDELEKAKQVILAVKPDILTFDSDTFADTIVSGETVLGHGWNGNFASAIADNPDRHIKFVVPKEGLTRYIDNLVIPATAPNPYTAEVLINYLHIPENAAKISVATHYSTPNEAAFKLLPEDLTNNPIAYPPKEMWANSEYITNVGDATQIYDRIWTEIKAQ